MWGYARASSAHSHSGASGASAVFEVQFLRTPWGGLSDSRTRSLGEFRGSGLEEDLPLLLTFH